MRISDTGKRAFSRAELQLVYTVPNSSSLKVTYAWKEAGSVKNATHTYPAKTTADASWSFTAGTAPETFYVEYAAE